MSKLPILTVNFANLCAFMAADETFGTNHISQCTSLIAQASQNTPAESIAYDFLKLVFEIGPLETSPVRGEISTIACILDQQIENAQNGARGIPQAMQIQLKAICNLDDWNEATCLAIDAIDLSTPTWFRGNDPKKNRKSMIDVWTPKGLARLCHYRSEKKPENPNVSFTFDLQKFDGSVHVPPKYFCDTADEMKASLKTLFSSVA